MELTARQKEIMGRWISELDAAIAKYGRHEGLLMQCVGMVEAHYSITDNAEAEQVALALAGGVQEEDAIEQAIRDALTPAEAEHEHVWDGGIQLDDGTPPHEIDTRPADYVPMYRHRCAVIDCDATQYRRSGRIIPDIPSAVFGREFARSRHARREASRA